MPRRVRLWLGPALMCVADAAVTLVGQSPDYWAGRREDAHEVNPLGLWLLHWHPLAFVAGVAVSLLLYLVLLGRTPIDLARSAAFVILFLHALGAASWFLRLGPAGYVLAVAWLLFASWLLGWSWREARKNDGER